MSAYPYENKWSSGFNPLDRPLGDSHHTDVPMIEADKAIGQKLSWYLGDLFLNSRTDSPREQWQRVARALRLHGLTIVEAPELRPAVVAVDPVDGSSTP